MRTNMVILGAYEGKFNRPDIGCRSSHSYYIMDFGKMRDNFVNMCITGELELPQEWLPQHDFIQYKRYNDVKELAHKRVIDMIIYLNRKRRHKKNK